MNFLLTHFCWPKASPFKNLFSSNLQHFFFFSCIFRLTATTAKRSARARERESELERKGSELRRGEGSEACALRRDFGGSRFSRSSLGSQSSQCSTAAPPMFLAVAFSACFSFFFLFYFFLCLCFHHVPLACVSQPLDKPACLVCLAWPGLVANWCGKF